MFKGTRRTGIIALGAGTCTYLWNKRCYITPVVIAEAVKNDDDRLSHPGPESRQSGVTDGQPQRLELKQVQVMFRHGARTPLHLIPTLAEAEYSPQHLLREHQASVFPYERVHNITGKPVEWSDYEKSMVERPLKSGATIGTLTAYGKDQVYLLGKKLKEDYRDKLGMATFEPQDVFVISSNIRRTVQSARGVLAGFYGKEQLQEYAKHHPPVKIRITDNSYNILIPDVYACGVLKKVNHASMYHSDHIQEYKADRLVIEKHLNDILEKSISEAREVQKRIDERSSSCVTRGSKKEFIQKFNKHRQPYLCDPDLYLLFQERGRIMAKVERLWSEVIFRNPNLAKIITTDDHKMLLYLRGFEVEQFAGSFHSGYRFHFYFDRNPYFHNEHLCKEVYTGSSQQSRKLSHSIPIVWKENAKLAPGSICQCCMHENKKNSSTTNKETSGKIQKKECTCRSSKPSFFNWYSEPTKAEDDSVGRVLKDEVWTNPVKFLEEHQTRPYSWQKNFDFVFSRDDLIARVAHGLPFPEELRMFEDQIDEHATTLLYYAMTGQHEAERTVVARLSAGPLMTTMVEQFENHMKGKQPTPKLCLYSSHDSTMTALLEVLGIWDGKWPPFAADIRLELYKDGDSSDYYVRLSYLGKVQRVRGQEKEYVHWRDFKKAVGKYLIQQKEYKSVCSSDILERIAEDLLEHEVGEVVAASDAPAGM